MSAVGAPTAAAVHPGEHRLRLWLVAACVAAGFGLAGSWELRHDAGTEAVSSGQPASVPLPAVAPLQVATPVTGLPVVVAGSPPVRAGVQVHEPSDASPGRLSVRPLADGRLDIHAVGSDRLQAITALAEATGTRLYGFESLPRSLGRITVQAMGVDRGTAWQRLLDGAAVGYAMACDQRSCTVWFAPAAAASDGAATAVVRSATTALAVGVVPAQRGESTEGEN